MANYVMVHAGGPPFAAYMHAFYATRLGDLVWLQYPYPDNTIPNDEAFLSILSKVDPKAIFFNGPYVGNEPSVDTFRQMREIAPVINLVSDCGDSSWLELYESFENNNCFDLQVSIDGVQCGPIELAVLTPVDIRFFGHGKPIVSHQIDDGSFRQFVFDRVPRDIHCGFSGSKKDIDLVMEPPPTPGSSKKEDMVWHEHPRWSLLKWLGEKVTIHPLTGNFADHTVFMRRCRIMVNTSWCQGGAQWPLTHQLKGRVLEAGWAGCCLLESAGSPIVSWYPEDCYYTYDSPEEARHLIETLSDDAIDYAASKLHKHTAVNYHPTTIYKTILSRTGV